MRKKRGTYLLRARKLDMEMPPDTLEAVGINELFVVVGVDVSFTTEQAASGCSDTVRGLAVSMIHSTTSTSATSFS